MKQMSRKATHRISTLSDAVISTSNIKIARSATSFFSDHPRKNRGSIFEFFNVAYPRLQMDDFRLSVTRRGFEHKGYVKFDEQTYPCDVTNMSATGAALHFKVLVELPERFTLQLRYDEKVMRACSITWDDGLQVGVLFS